MPCPIHAERPFIFLAHCDNISILLGRKKAVAYRGHTNIALPQSARPYAAKVDALDAKDLDPGI